MEHVIVTSLYLIREAGQTLHAAYVKEILEEASVPVSDTIKRNNILTFANRPDTTKKGTKGSGVQRQNMMLITQRFLLLHSRPDADMKDFQNDGSKIRETPSLIDRGMLRSGTKSDILKCLNALVTHLLPNKPLLWCWIWQLLFVWCDPRKQRHSASMCRFTSYHILRPKYPKLNSTHWRNLLHSNGVVKANDGQESEMTIPVTGTADS